ncbi:hypothetical protein J31TS4_44530 [Paenibacillus sp. J31TS4]|uniref:DUF2188 domain-containing protein n=1 Tax=Paenibacillus sp. J31TS4 TaxID=2807195 RepID=UPI001B198F4E|nr:DUF2188 domain-containing protein [Paenibacillus sp. J31TS4]GIP41173.1 hypothetical protein J31TS4_44530 [Paenibacillus sp. J31TS4]
MRPNNQHVVPHDGDWAVKSENKSKPEQVTKTKQEAVDAARERSKEEKSELVIHDRHGVIREKDSHGHDPYPPKG